LRLQSLTAAETLRRLGSSGSGLSSAEAARRRAEFGPNELEPRPARPAVLQLFDQLTHRFALILWVGAGLCFLSAWRDPGGGLLALGAAIVAVIAVNGVFSFVQEYRAEKAVAALQRLLPLRAQALRDGAPQRLEARELVPGDVLLLEAGDQVPADCRLLEALGVKVNTSALTGEPVPEARDARPSAEEDALRSQNLVLAGTFLVSGRARAVVIATGMQTHFGGILRLTQAERPPLSPLQREISRLAAIVAVLAGALGALFLGVGYALHLPLRESLLFAVGTIVANVPEGLLPTVTVSLAMAAQRMAKRNALVRRLPAVEALGAATVVCTDKTGTLTLNRMEVKALVWRSRTLAATPEALCELAAARAPLLHGAALCHDLLEGRGDPMELSLRAAAEGALGPLPARREAELPFDTDRRRLTTLHTLDGRLALHVKGAPEAVLPLCAFADAEGGARPMSAADREAIAREAGALADRGLRVLAFAHSAPAARAELASLERELTFAGLVALEDPPRPEVPAAIARCREAGIRVIMVTGDHPRTALAVARQIGLFSDGRALTGAELRRLTDAELQLALGEREILVARADAADKRRIVEVLRRKGEVVAVTGDGANDAPALRAADIGIAMGRSGTDVAREAADLVLLDDNFATIVDAVEEGRTVFANIRKFMTYILTSNVPELVPYLALVLLRAPLALTVLQILAVDLGTDLLPALALGAEPAGEGVMRRPPRRRDQRLIDRRILVRAYLWLGPMEAAAAMAAFFAVLHGGGWRWGAPLAASDPLYLQATTACLVAIVIMQVANVLACRSEARPMAARGLGENPLLAAGIAAELVLLLAVVYWPPAASLFGCAPPPASAWLLPLPFAAGLLILEEGRKAVMRQAASANGAR